MAQIQPVSRTIIVTGTKKKKQNHTSAVFTFYLELYRRPQNSFPLHCIHIVIYRRVVHCGFYYITMRSSVCLRYQTYLDFIPWQAVHIDIRRGTVYYYILYTICRSWWVACTFRVRRVRAKNSSVINISEMRIQGVAVKKTDKCN